ncbi:MAG: phosphotransferase enzyme family protein [Bacteroidia bacterium]
MKFPVSYSTLSADALLQLVIEKYGLSSQSSITFLKRGFNDTYRIDSGNEKFIFRVYKHNWRSHESIKTELQLIEYLRSNGIAISYALPGDTASLIQEIDAPEGTRYAVLFSYAEGTLIRKLNKEQSFQFGAETAKMHVLTTGKNFGETARDYSIEAQFEKTLGILKPVLKDHEDAFDYLAELQNEFLDQFGKINKNELIQGICHGDLQSENVHISGDQFTFFDLDFFGKGSLVYDIGVFCWYDHKNKPKEIIDAFIAGYQSRRALTDTELQLIPWFSTLRALFQMTLYCEISDGKQLSLWPAQQVAEFIKKVEKWHKGNRRS